MQEAIMMVLPSMLLGGTGVSDLAWTDGMEEKNWDGSGKWLQGKRDSDGRKLTETR